MDPDKDIEKANKIINYHKEKLGLRGTYKLKIKDKLAGKSKPDTLSLFLPNFLQTFRRNIPIEFDRQYFKELFEKEFTAVSLHELAHIKNKHGWIMILFFLLPVFRFGISSLILSIPMTLFFVQRRILEDAADKFVGEYDNSRYKDDMIEAIKKMELHPSTPDPLTNFFLKLSHPSGKDRIERLKNL